LPHVATKYDCHSYPRGVYNAWEYELSFKLTGDCVNKAAIEEIVVH